MAFLAPPPPQSTLSFRCWTAAHIFCNPQTFSSLDYPLFFFFSFFFTFPSNYPPPTFSFSLDSLQNLITEGSKTGSFSLHITQTLIGFGCAAMWSGLFADFSSKRGNRTRSSVFDCRCVKRRQYLRNIRGSDWTVKRPSVGGLPGEVIGRFNVFLKPNKKSKRKQEVRWNCLFVFFLNGEAKLRCGLVKRESR
jgi:hypothetical protein